MIHWSKALLGTIVLGKYGTYNYVCVQKEKAKQVSETIKI